MRSLLKPLFFVLCLCPALFLFYAVYLAFTGGENLLGPDPAKTLSLETGEWAIRFLILSLAITPIRYLFAWSYIWKYRRMVGLYALFYSFLHLLVFLWFLLQWQWSDIGKELSERPFISVGFAAFVLMLVLGLTSFNKAQRLMGRNWKRLHKLVYVINVLAVIHVIWIVRSSYADAVLYGSLVFLFLGYRFMRKTLPSVNKFSVRKIAFMPK